MIETLGSLYRDAGHTFPPIEERGQSISSAVPGTGAYDSLTFGMGPTYTGRAVTPNTAMTYTAVWCCVNGISKGLASVNLLTYRNLSPDGMTKELAITDYRYRLLREQPNDEQSSMQWRQFMLSSLLLWGNSYNYLEWDGRKRLKAIWPMRPDWMVVLRNPATKLLEYRYQPQDIASRVPAGVYDPWQILHIPGLGWDGVIGYSPIAMMRNAIALGQAQEEQSGRFIAGGGTQKVALVAPLNSKVLDPDAVRAEWNRRNGGMDKSGDVSILIGGMEPKTFGIPPKDAQSLEGRSWQLGEIARMYDYPLEMLYDQMGKPDTYASAEQHDIRLVKYTFRPWAELIEGKIDNSVLGSNDGLTCEHDLEDLKRGDLQSQMTAYSTGVRGSILRPNEARTRLRLPPDGNPLADKLLSQMQMVELGQAPPKLPQTAPTAPQADPAAPKA